MSTRIEVGPESIGSAIASGTPGSILYVGAGPVLAQDNSGLFYDATNHRLGIGTTNPNSMLTVSKGGAGALPEFLRFSSGRDYVWKSDTDYGGGGVNLKLTGGDGIDPIMYINNLGNVGIGTTPSSEFSVKGTGSTDASIAMNVFNSSNQNMLTVYNGGSVTYGDAALGGKFTFTGKTGTSYSWDFFNNVGNYMGILSNRSGATPFAIDSLGNVGIGLTGPTAVLHLKAGTATASTAPLKFTAGVLLSALELGALEFVDDGTNGHLYITRNLAGVLTRTLIV